jgi:pyrroline-5-carboxylate reductase
MKKGKSMQKEFNPVVFIGAGVFAEMLLKRTLGQGFLQSREVIATVRRKERAKQLKERYRIRVETDNLEAVRDSQVVILCVRPQDIEAVARSLSPVTLENKLLVSIVAGVSLQRLSDLFGANRVLRVNPNPQIEIGCGYTAIAASPGVKERERGWVKGLFDCAGEAEFLDEKSLDAVSALSGISHVLYFFECMVDAGNSLGLSKHVSEKIAYRSIMGTMRLLEYRKVSASELMREAMTPGGVSIEKIFVFENRGLKGILMDAMHAAKEKATALGNANLTQGKLS